MSLDPTLDKARFTWIEIKIEVRNFDNDLNLLLIDIAPAVIARKGHKGRHKVAHAFKRFYENDPRGKSSSFAEARYAANTKYGMSNLDMGRLEVGSLIGVLVNTVPTIVYMLYHIFSDEALLQETRAELETSILPEKLPDKKALNLNLAVLKEKSPLLQSTLQEVLRVYSRGASSRFVMEDTVLNSQYLLQQGSILMMPTAVIHSDPRAWGQPDFQARRFLVQKASVVQEPGSKRSSAASYRPFGGGATLCPGRHFASAEILALTAMIVYKYDLTPTSGRWTVPNPYQTSLATNIFPPKTDIEVVMSVRPGLEKTRWTFDANR